MIWNPNKKPSLLSTSQWICILSFFSVIKLFSIQKTYLTLILPLIGLYALFMDRRIINKTLPLFIMISLNFIPWIINGFPTDQLLRIGQLFLIIISLSFLSLNLSKKAINLVLTISIISTLVIFIVQLIINYDFITTILSQDQTVSSSIKGCKNNESIFCIKNELSRFAITGEINYSGLLFLGLFLLSILEKKKGFSVFFLLASFATLSRSIFMAFLVFFFLMIINKLFLKSKRHLGFGMIFLLLSYPFIYITIQKFIPHKMNITLMKSSPRHSLHLVYSTMGIDKFFGSGYSQAIKELNLSLEYYKKKYPFINTRHIKKYEQHSLQIQVLSDFGLVGYALFCLFMIHVFTICWKNSPIHAYSFIALLTNLTFLNGLSEWIFFFFIAYNFHIYLTTCTQHGEPPTFLKWKKYKMSSSF